MDRDPLTEAFLDAFASIEKDDTRIYHLHVSPKVFAELEVHERFAVEVFGGDTCSTKLWGAEVVEDTRLSDNKVMFRYKRRKSGSNGGNPVPETDWCDPDLFGTYRKRVTLVRPSERLKAG
jgi:hypothetical protein